MRIIKLDPTNSMHTRIVLAMVLDSSLDYGDLDTDPRLLCWINAQGQWGIAIADSGAVAGIACVVSLCDTNGDALLWLEVLPEHQRQGNGTALLTWAQSQARQPLLIKSVAGATGFYEHAGVIM